jgi:hypothetical protein
VREPGGSDPIDATAIARAALREGIDTLRVAFLDEQALDIRVLNDYRNQLVNERAGSRVPAPDVDTIAGAGCCRGCSISRSHDTVVGAMVAVTEEAPKKSPENRPESLTELPSDELASWALGTKPLQMRTIFRVEKRARQDSNLRPSVP